MKFEEIKKAGESFPRLNNWNRNYNHRINDLIKTRYYLKVPRKDLGKVQRGLYL